MASTVQNRWAGPLFLFLGSIVGGNCSLGPPDHRVGGETAACAHVADGRADEPAPRNLVAALVRDTPQGEVFRNSAFRFAVVLGPEQRHGSSLRSANQNAIHLLLHIYAV